MKHVYGVFEPNCVYRPIGVTAMILHDFKNSRSLPSPGLGSRMFTSKLRYAERRADVVLHCLWKGPQIFLAGTHPKQGSFAGSSLQSSYRIIPVLGYIVKRLETIRNSALKPRSDHLPPHPDVSVASAQPGTRSAQVEPNLATLQRG